MLETSKLTRFLSISDLVLARKVLFLLEPTMESVAFATVVSKTPDWNSSFFLVSTLSMHLHFFLVSRQRQSHGSASSWQNPQ